MSIGGIFGGAASNHLYTGVAATKQPRTTATDFAAALTTTRPHDTTQANAGSTARTYDFSNMTRQDIRNAGQELFKQGRITLDELFRFDHPDGKLHIGPGGNSVALHHNDRIDFISETRTAISNMEQTGEAKNPLSGYKMMLTLLDRLQALQGTPHYRTGEAVR